MKSGILYLTKYLILREIQILKLHRNPIYGYVNVNYVGTLKSSEQEIRNSEYVTKGSLLLTINFWNLSNWRKRNIKFVLKRIK